MLKTTEPQGFQIRDLNRDKGFWSARLVVDGESFTVDRKYGSWMLVDEVDGVEKRRDLLHRYAVKLQLQVRRIENPRPRAGVQTDAGWPAGVAA